MIRFSYSFESWQFAPNDATLLLLLGFCLYCFCYYSVDTLKFMLLPLFELCTCTSISAPAACAITVTASTHEVLILVLLLLLLLQHTWHLLLMLPIMLFLLLLLLQNPSTHPLTHRHRYIIHSRYTIYLCYGYHLTVILLGFTSPALIFIALITKIHIANSPITLGVRPVADHL